MRACLAIYGNRLASLLETATDLRFYLVDGEGARAERDERMPDGGVYFLASALAAAEADLLVCGGVSVCCQSLFAEMGIRVAPWIRGSVEEVLDALVAGRLDALAMPGCRGRCCRGKRMRGTGA